MSVKLVRLVSGEEILCDYLPLSDTKARIEKPVILVPRETGIALAPWMPYTKAHKDGVIIAISSILFTTDPIDELANNYRTAVGGIVVAKTEPKPTLKMVKE